MDSFVGTVLDEQRKTSRLFAGCLSLRVWPVLRHPKANVNLHGINAHLHTAMLRLGGVIHNVACAWNGSARPILPAPFYLSNEVGSTLASDITSGCHGSFVTMVADLSGWQTRPPRTQCRDWSHFGLRS